MQKIYPGVINHVWLPMVDSADFATLESAITAANLDVSVFGFLKGTSSPGSLVANGQGSLAASGRDFYVVHSGVFGIILGAAELSDTQNAVYDKYLIFASATGAAINMIEVETEWKDSSDIYSLISDMNSTMGSQFAVVSNYLSNASNYLSNISLIASDAHSAAILAASHASNAHSLVSDVDSQLTITASKVALIEGSQFDVISNYLSNASNYLSNISALLSDVDSQLLLNASMISDVQSQVDLLDSALVAKRGSTTSNAADASTLWVAGLDHDSQFNGWYVRLFNGSQVDELRQIVDTNKTASRLTVAPAFNSAVVSGVDYAIVLGNPLISVVQANLSGMVSDAYSLLSSLNSDVQSRMPQNIASIVWDADKGSYVDASSMGSVLQGATATPSAIAAKVWSDYQSKVGQSPSQVYSNTSDALSNILSMLTVAGLTKHIASLVWDADKGSYVDASSMGSVLQAGTATPSAVAAKVWSDYESKVGQSPSQVFSNLSDALSNLLSRVPKAVATQSQLSDVRSDLRSQISGITASVSASDISDIASAVWAEKWRVHSLASSFGSAFSNLWTAANQGSSRALIAASAASDAHSMAVANSDAISNVISMLTAAGLPEHIASLVWDADKGSYVDASSMGSVLQATGATPSAIADKVWSDYQSKVGQTPSQVFSNLSDALSNLLSRIGKSVATASALSDAHSDLRSQISGITASVSASDISDIASAVWAAKWRVHSLASSFGSAFSNLWTSADAAASRALLNQSSISEVQSAIDSQFAYLSNAISDMHSDLTSQISNIGGTALTTSDISDIASRVWSEKWRVHSSASSFGSAFSAMWTSADAAASRALVNQSLISDVDSQLLLTASKVTTIEGSQFDYLSAAISDVHSDLRSQISGITAGVSASDISDIASAVWAEKYRVHSLASSFGSAFSNLWTDAKQARSLASDAHSLAQDIDSQLTLTDATVSNINSVAASIESVLSDLQSDFQSRVPKRVATDSQLSNVHSDLRSQVSGITAGVSASDISDIASAVWAEKWRVHSNASSFGSAFSAMWTDAKQARSLASDAHSLAQDIDSQLTVTHSLLSDIDSAVSSQFSQLDSVLSNVQSVVTAIQSDLPSLPVKNTALAGFTFPMVDSADNVSFKTGLTVTGQVSLDGAALGALTNSVTELSNGLYSVDLAAADMNGDVVVLRFSASGANDRIITILTQPT